jgi:hypothetical protein
MDDFLRDILVFLVYTLMLFVISGSITAFLKWVVSLLC